MKKVFLLGDSVMKGVVFDSLNNRYTTLNDDRFDALRNKYQCEIVNLSQFGLTAKKAYARGYHKKIIEGRGDIAIISLGGNDCDYNWEDVGNHPTEEHFCNNMPEEFTETLTAMLNELKDGGVEPVLVSLPPISSEKYFNWIVKKANASGVAKWLKSVCTIYKWQEFYSNIIVKVANKNKIDCIDIRMKLLPMRDYEYKYLSDDGIHLSEEGEKLYVSEIGKYLRAKLSSQNK